MADVSSKRFNVKPLWVAAILILSCVGLFVFQLFGPDPTIVVSKATTHITAPLDEDRLPDYEAFWMQRASEGVTRENNAAVLIWQALWPSNLGQEHWLPLCDALGLEEIPSEEESLLPVYSLPVREQLGDWLHERHVMPEEMDLEQWNDLLRGETAEELIDEAIRGPWTSEQIPPLALWVEGNKTPFDRLVEGTARAKYYSPSPSFLDGSRDGLISMLLPDIQNMRTAARALKVRAMYHLGEGRPAEAWQDLLACHRLARLAATNQTLVGQLVAMAIDGLACSATQRLLHHGELSESLAQQILDDLRTMRPCSDTVYAIDQGERHFFLDSVLLMATGNTTAASLFGGTGGSATAIDNVLSRIQVNWNLVLKTGNLWYDRIAAASKLPTRAERSQAFDAIYSDLNQSSARSKRPAALFGSVFSRNQRSKLVTNMFLSMFLPAIHAASSAQDRVAMVLEMTRIAAALAVYRARHGEYPAQLPELVPAIFPEMPLDLYSSKPFIYERKPDGGYLLYSMFENGADDRGTDYTGEIIDGEWVEMVPEEFEYGSQEHDIVIRMPVPVFEMPEPPQAEELSY